MKYNRSYLCYLAYLLTFTLKVIIIWHYLVTFQTNTMNCFHYFNNRCLNEINRALITFAFNVRKLDN